MRTAHVLMAFESLSGWRPSVSGRHEQEFAEKVRRLAEEDYLDAEKIRLVCDNLSPYSAAAFYETFPAEQARSGRGAWLGASSSFTGRCSALG